MMTKIHLITTINAPVAIVFDLARNLNIHQQSVAKTNENIVGGRRSGLIEYNEIVTWRGKHFGLYLRHTSRITAMKIPKFFVDEMEKGLFKSFRHEHFFEEKEGLAVMTDILQYEVPYGFIGRFFDRLLLSKHLRQLLLERNEMLKELSENEQ